MLRIASQTAGPIGRNFFVDTHGWEGSVTGQKIRIFFLILNFFPRATPGPLACDYKNKRHLYKDMLNPWTLNFVNLYPNVSHLLSRFVKIHVHYIVIEYIYCIYISFSSYIVFLNYLFIKINIIIKSIFFEIYFIG